MNRPLLIRAAEILEREAAVLKESYTSIGKRGARTWNVEDSLVHVEYEEMVRVAGELRKEAA